MVLIHRINARNYKKIHVVAQKRLIDGFKHSGLWLMERRIQKSERIIKSKKVKELSIKRNIISLNKEK